MERFTYLGVLAFIVLGSAWLEFALRTRVFRRRKRLVLTVGPVLVLFLVWDYYAIQSGHWSFSDELTTGALIRQVPIEEALFFVVVPVAAILTLEAVRSARGWRVGDESGPQSQVKSR